MCVYMIYIRLSIDTFVCERESGRDYEYLCLHIFVTCICMTYFCICIDVLCLVFVCVFLSFCVLSRASPFPLISFLKCSRSRSLFLTRSLRFFPSTLPSRLAPSSLSLWPSLFGASSCFLRLYPALALALCLSHTHFLV